MGLRIAINGFGRIGRNFMRVVAADACARKELSIIAMNIGPSRPEMLAHLFKYDSLLGKFPGIVEMHDNYLIIDDYKIQIFAEKDPQVLDWKSLNIDWVVEASGKFTQREGAQLHIHAGAKKVLITAPAKNEDVTIIPGVNDEIYDTTKHTIVSLGSCTTNAALTTLKILDQSFGIEYGFMVTTHAYTNSQVLLDVEANDMRRARAAAINIIPTTTGAMNILDRVYPPLAHKIAGMAMRVPIAKVSLLDITFISQKNLSKEAINNVFGEVANTSMKGILAISYEPLVSSDYNCNSNSVIIDGLLTDVRGNCGKVFGWYDNEWGYSERLKDFLMASRIK